MIKILKLWLLWYRDWCIIYANKSKRGHLSRRGVIWRKWLLSIAIRLLNGCSSTGRMRNWHSGLGSKSKMLSIFIMRIGSHSWNKWNNLTNLNMSLKIKYWLKLRLLGLEAKERTVALTICIGQSLCLVIYQLNQMRKLNNRSLQLVWRLLALLTFYRVLKLKIKTNTRKLLMMMMSRMSLMRMLTNLLREGFPWIKIIRLVSISSLIWSKALLNKLLKTR